MRHVVITGAAGGLGAALSRHFLGLGCQVTGLDRAELPADLIATPGFVARQADIVDEAAMEAAMEEAAAGDLLGGGLRMRRSPIRSTTTR